MSCLSLLTAVTAGFEPFLAALLISLGRSQAAGTPVSLVVLHRDLSTDARRQLASLLPPPHTVRWLSEAEADPHGQLAQRSPHYLRLLLHRAHPDAERVLYLDADTIVLDDLSPLLSLPLHGCTVGAVVDWLSSIREGITDWRRFDLSPDAPYFNSGVLVVNTTRWVQTGVPERVLSVAEAIGGACKSPQGWPQHDQSPLNVVLHGDWLPISPRWNHFSERAIEDPLPAVVHFLGNGKPGSATCQEVFSLAFEALLADTPW